MSPAIDNVTTPAGSELHGRTALVTGAGSPRGIGWATALELARLGARIGLADLNHEGSSALAGRITAEGGEAVAVRADVSSRSSVAELIGRVEAMLGPITILVNNAGITQPAAFADITDEDWDRIQSVNLKSCFICAQAVLASMIAARFGRIVCVSSIAARDGATGFGGVHYATSKAGMLGFVRALARELAPHNITVNAVAPGSIDTDITQGKGQTRSGLSAADYERERIARTPLGRLGSPGEIAATIGFYAGRASFVTGTVLDVNGGRFIG